MKQLVEFPLEGGGTVLVEVERPVTGPVTRGFGKDQTALAERADKTFEEAAGSVIPAARSLLGRIRGMQDPPDEISVEFGVQLSADARAFIASVSAEANFRVSLTWRSAGSSDES